MSLIAFHDLEEGQHPRLSILARQFMMTAYDASFPCIYATRPFERREVFFSLHQSRASTFLASVCEDVVDVVKEITINADTMGVILIESETQEASLINDFDLAHHIVAALNCLSPEDPARDYTDPKWMLTVDGVGLFINFSTPRHKVRRSRNVCDAFALIVQERASFDRLATSKARSIIRRRLEDYDGVPAHPSLGSYGDTGNRERLQYFLGDGLETWDVMQDAETLP